ncbi:MAG TPA: hypothetical protein DHW39_10615 [Erysipelotrichaceae bacterium]|nr:hypothetical protein [Erysipelotrichaceae bacterium]
MLYHETAKEGNRNMVRINVTAPVLTEQIRKRLLESKSPEYIFVKNLSRIQMQFEVDTEEDGEVIVRKTKRLIRSMKYGNIIMFRVLIDGQFFENGKVYTPEDREYLATRPAK